MFLYLSVTPMVLYICYVSLRVRYRVLFQGRIMGQATTVIPLHAAEGDAYDPDRLRVRPDDIPTTKVETGAARRRKAARSRLFVPSTAWPEFAAVVAAGMSGRAVGLWLAIRMQARLEGQEWVRVRTHLRESL